MENLSDAIENKKDAADDEKHESSSAAITDAKGMEPEEFHVHKRRVAKQAENNNKQEHTSPASEFMEADEGLIAGHFNLDQAKESAEQFVKKVWEETVHFMHLPEWLQDNDYLHRYHRPPLPSFSACFASIFRVHTETGNIWTHMLGCLAFIGVAMWFVTRPVTEIQMQEKLVFSAFFLGAILCLGLSFTFHTLSCHSPSVGKLFSKLDYLGISLLIVGSFVPWLYYGFYCSTKSKLIYLILISVLGGAGITVSMFDKFATPDYRALRAGVFIGLGGSGVVPGIHYMIVEGVYEAFFNAALGWLFLMGALYICGALLYAWRVPERFFPGKCDLMFQSHQIFHLFVVAAAFVHYHGINQLSDYRIKAGCPSCDIS